MKNIIICVLILLCYSEIDAQIYSNQPKYFPQGTSWVWSTKDFGCEHLSFVISRYSIKGSKIFNQKEYYCVEKISSGIVEEVSHQSLLPRRRWRTACDDAFLYRIG